MVSNNFYTKNQIEKLGNTIIYLTNNIQPLYKTKVLKLIYLIEEISIKKHGIPFFGFDFQLWHLGPVAKDVFIDLSSTPVLLEGFIDAVGDGEGKTIKAKKTFLDDEFSDLDMQILDTVVNTFKNYSAKELVEITHREHFPWHTTAKNLGYLELFEKKQCLSTDIVLDLSTLLDQSPELKSFYLSNLEFQKQSNHLKGNN